MKRWQRILLVGMGILLGLPATVTARPLALPPAPDGWTEWYEIDFRNGWDGHWSRINGPTPYLDCNLDLSTTTAEGGLSLRAEGLEFWADHAHVPNTLYTNNILPPQGEDFLVRWKIKWIIPYEGWGMGFYFGTQPYTNEWYYEHPVYCPEVMNPYTAPLSRITGMQGDDLSSGEIGQWFHVKIAYEAATRTATHYTCNADWSQCEFDKTQILPAHEDPISFHMGHIKRVHGAGNFQRFVIQYLQVYHQSQEVTIHVQNPEGTPVPRGLEGVAYDPGFWGITNLLTEGWGYAASHTDEPPEPEGRAQVGARVAWEGNDVHMGGWADGGGTVFVPNVGPSDPHSYCAWNADTFSGGECTVVLATATPTPTPYLDVAVRDPQGNLVPVSALAAGAFRTSDPGDQHTATCSDCATVSSALPPGYDGALGVEIRYTDPLQILVAWSISLGSASFQQFGQQDQVLASRWQTGGREVEFVVATATPTPTPSPTPTPTPEPGILTVDYPWLVWYGPDVGRETQVIRGRRFQPQEDVEIRVIGPPDADGDPDVCGRQTTYSVQADAAGTLILDAIESGDPYFGTQCKGVWQAQATGQDTGLATNTVNWSVAWFPARRDR